MAPKKPQPRKPVPGNLAPKHPQLRLIGGEWRSRQVQFPNLAAVRPTPDRVRETLFNWLRTHIHGARCLEPFAGSGALSLESLSRGASFCYALDLLPETLTALNVNLKTLGAAEARYRCERADARSWLRDYTGEPFDLIFLDPPFADKDTKELLALAMTPALLAKEGLVYVETDAALEIVQLPERSAITRQKKAGTVHYALVARQ
jgi:16S rRNA (guanine966-N2)-methyltransferase